MTLTRSIFLAWLIAAFSPFLVAGTLSEGAPYFTSLSGPVSVPAEIAGHVMFVNILVNGHGPFRVLVDTGCSISVVSPELAEAAGALVPDLYGVSDPVVALNGFGDPTDLQRIVLESIELGGARFEGVPAVISDSFEKLSAIDGRRVDGALGFPLFADLFLGLDYPNQRLLLSSQWPANVPAVRASLPVVEHADVPFVQVQLQGRPVELMIDTGANQALQLPNERAPSFQWKVAPRVGSMVAVFGEVGREAIGRLSGSLSIGGLEQIDPTAIVSAGPARLGLRSLERFCVIFHQTENRVWLCGPNPAPIEPAAERSIGLSVYSEPGGFRIAGVIPGSPAEEAHLAAGALITQIEHRPAASWTRDQMEQWIDSHAEVALVVADKHGERALNLGVWDLVP
jgi:predicted aspartyl protease